MAQKKLFNRELSWLSFNHRVLQECLDPDVPLYEKIKFMAIFSSNLDEFFRVRVASLRNLLNLKNKDKRKFSPSKLLDDIHKKVDHDQQLLGSIFRDTILPELSKRKVHLVDEGGLTQKQLSFAKQYFEDQIQPYLKPIFLSNEKNATPFLNNKALYLAIKLSKNKNEEFVLTEIPVSFTGRFIQLPQENNEKYVIFIDDIMRLFVDNMFKGQAVKEMYSIKLTRDAEMYIDDEFSGSLLQKIKDGISRRKKGVPSRFLYDEKMPAEFLKSLKTYLSLSKDDLVAGGKYHNFNDFFTFPKLVGKNDFDIPHPPLPCKDFDNQHNYFNILSSKNVMLNFPYQSYNYVIQFLKQAAIDELVTEIKITLYRIANPSQVVESLITAAKNGKSVTVFVELKARFDEESNIDGATELEEAGVKVIYSIPGIKVHSKICLISRSEKSGLKYYAYLATGNFNEKTSKIYGDLGLFTSDPLYTNDLNSVFAFLDGRTKKPVFESLLVAPFNMLSRFKELIQQEIDNARNGKKAEIIIKLNSLQDSSTIKYLYKANQNGVKVRIIVRGICCLIPGKKGLSENIEARSIIDRYLEHTRIYVFHNDGKPKYYTGSADWMSRNLKRRIEVIFPVNDKQNQDILKQFIDIQWNDNKKARIIDKAQINQYVEESKQAKTIRSQEAIYQHLKKINS